MMVIGAAGAQVAANAFNANTTNYIASIAGHSLSWLIYIVILLGAIAINVLNLYGGFMSITTTVSPFSHFSFRGTSRATISAITAVVGTGIAIWGQGNFLTNYSNFLLLLLYFMVPWTAINLVDFYLLRKGSYDLEAIFHRGGIYKDINWIAIIAYIVAILIEFPFMNTTLYTGFLAKAFGDADFAWIVGLIVASILYYYPSIGRLSRN